MGGAEEDEQEGDEAAETGAAPKCDGPAAAAAPAGDELSRLRTKHPEKPEEKVGSVVWCRVAGEG